MRITRKLKITIGTATLLFLASGSYLGIQQLRDNFHEVIPNRLYRSGQLEEGELTAYVQRHNIKSVLNLRGDNTGSDWYDSEIKEARSLGLTHLNFRMSSKRELTADQAAQLVSIMQSAPKPMLIHCQGGSDRSGLASALYVAATKDFSTSRPPDEQLSIFYGHMPSFGTDKMCRTYDTIKSRFTNPAANSRSNYHEQQLL